MIFPGKSSFHVMKSNFWLSTGPFSLLGIKFWICYRFIYCKIHVESFFNDHVFLTRLSSRILSGKTRENCGKFCSTKWRGHVHHSLMRFPESECTRFGQPSDLKFKVPHCHVRKNHEFPGKTNSFFEKKSAYTLLILLLIIWDKNMYRSPLYFLWNSREKLIRWWSFSDIACFKDPFREN